MEKTYRNIDYTEVQDFAFALNLNAENSENHREAAQLLFSTREFISNYADRLKREFDQYVIDNEPEDPNFEAWVYQNYSSKINFTWTDTNQK